MLPEQKFNQHDNRLFTGKYRKAESCQSAGRDPAVRREQELDCGSLGDGGCKRPQERAGPETGGSAASHETGRYVDRHGDIPFKPDVDRCDGDHGQVPQETDQPLHDQGGIHLRQFDQQQGAVFCLRTGGRDRAQSDLDADEGGFGAAPCRGHGARTPKRVLYQVQRVDREPCGRYPDVGAGAFDHAYLQFLRAVARYVRQVPAQLSVDSAGRSEKGGPAQKTARRASRRSRNGRRPGVRAAAAFSLRPCGRAMRRVFREPPDRSSSRCVRIRTHRPSCRAGKGDSTPRKPLR